MLVHKFYLVECLGSEFKFNLNSISLSGFEKEKGEENRKPETSPNPASAQPAPFPSLPRPRTLARTPAPTSPFARAAQQNGASPTAAQRTIRAHLNCQGVPTWHPHRASPPACERALRPLSSTPAWPSSQPPSSRDTGPSLPAAHPARAAPRPHTAATILASRCAQRQH